MVNNIEQKKELIVQSYSKTFDKEMAYTKVGITEDEVELLDNDINFQKRLENYLIDERERLINNLRNFMDSKNEKISYDATIKMAEVLYPEFFKEGKKPDIIINNNLTDFSKFSDEELKVIISKRSI